MPSYAELCCRQLPNPGTRGSWKQRLAEGLANLDTFNGASVGSLDGNGPWLSQLFRAMSPTPDFDHRVHGTWTQMLVNGGWDLMLEYTQQSIASGDFTNIATNNAADGVYTLNGTPCVIGDIIDLTHDYINFDPLLDIDAGGIKARPVEPEGSSTGRTMPLADPLRTDLMTNGFTVVIEMYIVAGTAGGFNMYDMDFIFNSYANIELGNRHLYWGDDPDVFDGLDLTAGIHKFAITATAGRMAISSDGAATISAEEGFILAGQTEIELAIGGHLDARLRSFAFYDVVDDADLPTLSAL